LDGTWNDLWWIGRREAKCSETKPGHAAQRIECAADEKVLAIGQQGESPASQQRPSPNFRLIPGCNCTWELQSISPAFDGNQGARFETSFSRVAGCSAHA